VFLHSITCLPNKDINKHLVNTLGNTDDVKFSLKIFLNFNLIKNYFKLHISSSKNRTILNITFKFIAGPIYDSYMITSMHLEKSED
jgi:hypothetical protein